MPLVADYQKLEPGNEVTLFELDCTAFGGDILRFHNSNKAFTQAQLEAALTSGSLPPRPIIFGGVSYTQWPLVIEGLEMSTEGAAPTPTLQVGNVEGAISGLCFAYADLLQAKLIVRTTLAKYLDAANWPEGNATADYTQFMTQIWYIERKTEETNEAVTFELNSPADVSGTMIPCRQLHAVCQWAIWGEYRGSDCGYTGPAVAKKDGTPTSNPAEDDCGALVTDCKLRFGEHGQLPFGGFPGTSLMVR